MALRILVIDDEPDTRDSLEIFLASKGAEAVTSDFPDSIGDLVDQVHPDVVLIDLKNRSNPYAGLGMLGTLRSYPQTESLPVLVMSADHAWLSALAPSLEHEGAGVVPMPLDLNDLWTTIEQTAKRA